VNTYLRLLEETLLSIAEAAIISSHLPSTKAIKGLFTSTKKEMHRNPLPEKTGFPKLSQKISPPALSKTEKTPPLDEIKEDPILETPKDDVAPKTALMKAEKAKPALLSSKNEIKKLIERVHPHVRLSFEIPNDEKATTLATVWKEREKVTSVTILSFAENSREEEFLHQIANAVTAYLLPAQVADGRLLEKEKKWETFLDSPALKWIIADQFPKAYYRENLASSEKFLGATPLILISPISFYFKNPEAKRALWKTLCATLRSS
jgi:hypothetical protein